MNDIILINANSNELCVQDPQKDKLGTKKNLQSNIVEDIQVEIMDDKDETIPIDDDAKAKKGTSMKKRLSKMESRASSKKDLNSKEEHHDLQPEKDENVDDKKPRRGSSLKKKRTSSLKNKRSTRTLHSEKDGKQNNETSGEMDMEDRKPRKSNSIKKRKSRMKEFMLQDELEKKIKSLKKINSDNKELYMKKMSEANNRGDNAKKLAEEYEEKLDLFNVVGKISDCKTDIAFIKKENVRSQRQIFRTSKLLESVEDNNRKLYRSYSRTSKESLLENVEKGNLMHETDKYTFNKKCIVKKNTRMAAEIGRYHENYESVATDRLMCQRAMNEIEKLINECKKKKLKKQLKEMIDQCHNKGAELLKEVEKEFGSINDLNRQQ